MEHLVREEAVAITCRGFGYGYDQVTLRILLDDLNFSLHAAQVGDVLPDFDLPTTTGAKVRRSELVGDKPIFLFTGSLSCPMTVSSNVFLRELHRRFGHHVSFLMIYVREAHPGEGCPQPKTLDEKLQHAGRLQERDDLPWQPTTYKAAFTAHSIHDRTLPTSRTGTDGLFSGHCVRGIDGASQRHWRLRLTRRCPSLRKAKAA